MQARTAAMGAALALATALAAPLPAQTADSIIALNVAARGGLARLRAVRTERLVGRIEFAALGAGAGADTVEIERPSRIRTTIHMGRTLIVQGADGPAAWTQTGPDSAPRTRKLAGYQALNVQAGADIDGPLIDHAARGITVSFGGLDTADGRPAWKLRVVTAQGLHDAYYVDRATHLVSKWSRTTTANGVARLVESYFRDYRRVDGVAIAFRIVSDDGHGAPTARITFDRVDLNVPVDRSRFRMPR